MTPDQGQLVELSRAEPADAFSLAALELQLNRERGRPGEPGFLDRYADAWLADRGHRPAWLATSLDGRPLGGLMVHVVEGLPAPGRRARAWALVTTWYVTPGARGAGLGERLMRAASGWCTAREMECVRLIGYTESGLPRRLGFGPARESVLELPLR